MAPVPQPRRPTGTAFAIRDVLPWKDLSAIVRASETAGYSGVFLPEISGRDALVTLGALAGETRDLLLAPGVLPLRSRTPMLTAMAAATVHERSGGRLVLGLGTGWVGRRALDELRELVLTLRTLFRGEPLERDGRRLRLALSPGSEVPIWIGALGPKAMRLAGEVADVAFARERVAEGASAAGRDPGDVTVAAYVRSWVGDDVEAGTMAFRAAAGEYASYPLYARQFAQLGLGAEAEAAAAAHRAGRLDEVPEALVRTVGGIGEDAPRHLAAYRDAGADLPVVYPVSAGDPAASIEGTLLALAPG
jgi:alkanesulfonate monooxygenase SsuD/methylene tetrahydromethanopterin reductase-like flavin-dependent oxidoreductase (luciferase family)